LQVLTLTLQRHLVTMVKTAPYNPKHAVTVPPCHAATDLKNPLAEMEETLREGGKATMGGVDMSKNQIKKAQKKAHKAQLRAEARDAKAKTNTDAEEPAGEGGGGAE